VNRWGCDSFRRTEAPERGRHSPASLQEQRRDDRRPPLSALRGSNRLQEVAGIACYPAAKSVAPFGGFRITGTNSPPVHTGGKRSATPSGVKRSGCHATAWRGRPGIPAHALRFGVLRRDGLRRFGSAARLQSRTIGQELSTRCNVKASRSAVADELGGASYCRNRLGLRGHVFTVDACGAARIRLRRRGPVPRRLYSTALRHDDARPKHDFKNMHTQSTKRVLLPGSIDRLDEPHAATVSRKKRISRKKRTPTKTGTRQRMGLTRIVATSTRLAVAIREGGCVAGCCQDDFRLRPSAKW
jgi:hypothetical protein